MFETPKRYIFNFYDWLRLHIVTPENFVLSLLFITIYNKRVWLVEKLPVINNASFLVPLAAPILSQPVGAFFGRLRENREFTIIQNVENQKQIREDIDTYFRTGEVALTQRKYLDAEQNFRLAHENMKKLYGQTNRSALKHQIRIVVYKQALSLFYMNKFNDALELTQKELSSGNKNDNKDILNLRGLIYFKLNDFEKALEDFDCSFKIDSTQNTIYMFKLFLSGDYNAVLKHVAFDGVAGDTPLKADEPLVTYELLQVFGESSAHTENYLKAILFFNAVERALPPTVIYMPERIVLLLHISDSYKAQADKIYDEEKCEIKFLEKPSERLTNLECAKKAENTLARAIELFQEMGKYFSKCPRYDCITKMIDSRTNTQANTLLANSRK